MTAKEYLRQAYKLDELIKDKKDQIKDLKMLLESLGAIDYSKDRVQTSQQADAAFVNQLAKLNKLETELNNSLNRMFKLRIEITHAIEKVEDVNCRLVLSKRYVLMKKWERIAEEMNYSVVQIHRIHGEALKIFEVPKHDV